MISFDDIKSFFGDTYRRNPAYFEYMLKEYFHYRILDIMFSGENANKLSFIGGTCLRILHRIQRFSEDLDFDCFNLSREEFIDLTDRVIHRLARAGITMTSSSCRVLRIRTSDIWTKSSGSPIRSNYMTES
ncbi:MAG: nucleotidyl transferase AbiEii/AbiGii toxin family protein [Bacteroidales bacterium]|nr:nucleotidyl transferase AbiEii/AbiGii toxin family protein [Bacteroidales bacterium]